MSLTSDISIIYEDEDILVVDKPCGLVVNSSETSPDNTFQDYLGGKLNLSYEGEYQSEFIERKGLVHRLDKDTSGILISAKNEPSFNNLKQQFKTRKVTKDYLAVVLGEVSDKKIEVDAPIKRDPKNRTRMSVHSEGRLAVTRFELLNKGTGADTSFSLLKASPETGRTHQIRVHLCALGFPIFGDEIYMTRKQLELSAHYFDRLMLHAWKISFQHPKTLKEESFEAVIPKDFVPYLPEDLKQGIQNTV